MNAKKTDDVKSNGNGNGNDNGDEAKTEIVDDKTQTDIVDESEIETEVVNVHAKTGSGDKWDKHASHEDKCEALGVDPDYANITAARNQFPEMSQQQFRKFVSDELGIETE